MPRHHVLLVPGFFGFTSFGEFAYFEHVRDHLADVGPAAGIDGDVAVVKTVPTASLRQRAALVVDAIAALVGSGRDAVSLVGHSSGGLDARLVVTPDASLPTKADVERCARAVRAVVSVSAPHRGTPVAHLFNSLLGQQLLKVLSVWTMYALRAGRIPIRVGLRLARLLRRRDAPPGSALEHLLGELLQDFTPERRKTVEEFWRQVGNDQDLLAQITPAGADVFNAATGDRPGVRYGCVVTRARPPGIRSALGAGLDPYAQVTHAIYVGLYRIAARTPRSRTPELAQAQWTALSRAFRARTDVRANDGMIPTLSQVWGEVVHATWADHLDVIGHFHRPTHVPPHFDWLTSGSGFDRAQFERAWRDVAAFVGGAR